MPQLSCRFYEKKLPDVDQVVMVTVSEITDLGAYVKLLEYDGAKGLILMTEMSRKRIRSINKLVRVGRNECVLVTRVDQEKGYLDLSKRRVVHEDIKQTEEKYSRCKTVNQILRHVGELLDYEDNKQLEDLYKRTAWFFDKKYATSGGSYERFKEAAQKPEVLDELDMDPHTKEYLLKEIKRKLTPQAVKVRADVEVCCYSYEGIDAVKNALRAGLVFSSEEVPLKINLIAPPLYVISVTLLNEEKGVEVVKISMAAIKESIEAAEGNFEVKLEPKVVSETDDKKLQDEMEQRERAMQEWGNEESVVPRWVRCSRSGAGGYPPRPTLEDIKNQLQLKPVILMEEIVLRSEFCGKIIGKGGDNLRGIEDKSRSRIRISREPHNEDPLFRLCTIEGTKEEIDHAKMLLDAEIMEELEMQQRRQQREEVESLQKKSVTSFESYDLAESLDLPTTVEPGPSVQQEEEPGPSGTNQEQEPGPSNQELEPGPSNLNQDNISVEESAVSFTIPSNMSSSLHSDGFSYDSSHDMVVQDIEVSPPPTTIDEDMKRVELRIIPEPSPALESYSLPPLINQCPSTDMESQSGETLTCGTPPSSMMSSLASNLSTASTVIQKKMTADLKSLLGIKSNVCPIYPYIDYLSTGTIESGVVSSALCTRHIWIVDRDGSEFRDLTVALADGSTTDIDRATDVQKGEVYIFRDDVIHSRVRVKVTESVQKSEPKFGVVDCYDIDTGIPFTVPVSRLYYIVESISRSYPPNCSSFCHICLEPRHDL
eukprot:sb/3462319/